MLRSTPWLGFSFLNILDVILPRFWQTCESKVQKPPSQLRFSLPSLNHNYDHKQRTLKHRNTQNGSKSHQSQIANDDRQLAFELQNSQFFEKRSKRSFGSFSRQLHVANFARCLCLSLSKGWFSYRKGTSVDEGARKSINWLEQWQSDKFWAPSPLRAFSRRQITFPFCC